MKIEIPFPETKFLKIGTDCSGIEAPIQALKKLKISFSHEFACEKDPYAIQSIKANYEPKILFDDMTKNRNLPKVDIYVCGFPCQPFSFAGKQLGSKDKRNIFPYCIKTIKECRPTIFILENVKALIYNDYYKVIQNSLNKLENYEIYYNIFNTKDYGIPQNRERLYIVGLLKNKMKKQFEVPKHKKLKDIMNFIDLNDKNTSELSRSYFDAIKESKGIFIDICFIRMVSSECYQTYSPTITANCQLWCKPKQRRANIKELLSLQGFPISFKQVVSNTQLKKQIGNSMSVNVLMVIFEECFKCVNFQ